MGKYERYRTERLFRASFSRDGFKNGLGLAHRTGLQERMIVIPESVWGIQSSSPTESLSEEKIIEMRQKVETMLKLRSNGHNLDGLHTIKDFEEAGILE